MEKLFVTPQELYDGAFLLANKILDSKFKPNYIIALWRGGCPIGAVVQDYLAYNEIPSDHYAIRTSGRDKKNNIKKIEIHGLNEILKKIKDSDSILLVDDIYDSGLTMQEVIAQIAAKTKAKVKVATVFYKPTKNQTKRVPDYYVNETDAWVVFPHEFCGLSSEEIENNKGKVISNFFKNK